MDEQGLEAHQLPLHLADDSVQAQRLVLAKGMLAQKNRMLLATILGVSAMITLVITSYWTHELDIIDAVLSGVLALGYLVSTMIMLRVNEQSLYGLLFWWIVGTLTVMLALLFNALHGSRLLTAADSSIPYVLGYVPVGILFIHAYLIPKTAWLLTLIFAALATLITLSSMWLQTGNGELSSGTLWTLVCVTLLPIHTALLANMNYSNHGEIVRVIVLENLSLQEQSESLADAEIIDSVTGGLNEAGVRRRLKTDLASHPDLKIAMLQHRPVADQANLPDTEIYSHALQQTASHVRMLLGEGTRWGRIRDKVFVLWNPGVDEIQIKNRLDLMPASFVSAGNIDYSITGLSDFSRHNSLSPDFDLLIEAENRLFINSMKK